MRAAALAECAGCGAAFRVAYTDGLCPICGRVAEGAAAPRPRKRLGERRIAVVVILAAAVNVAILSLVAVALSGR